MRRTSDIREQEARATDSVCEGTSRWPGMTYEEGVQAALLWILAETDDPPMPDDE